MAKVDASQFLRVAQVRTARIAASASATRRQGRGAAKAAREFFADLDLRRFSVGNAETFHRRLDEATEQLEAALPPRARSWGLARKLTNIFLRDALYTTYVCESFGLATAEKFFEVPLDSITAGRLRKDAGRGVLPQWTGVKHLTPDASDQYQFHAERLAKASGLARVHLDTYWWGERVDDTIAQPRAAGDAPQAAHPCARARRITRLEQTGGEAKRHSRVPVTASRSAFGRSTASGLMVMRLPKRRTHSEKGGV